MEKFSELKYVRPDMPAIAAETERAVAALESAADYKAARAAFMEVERISSKIETIASLASVRNTLDTTDKFYEDEVNYMSAESAKMTGINKRGAQALLNSPFRADFEAEFGTQLTRTLAAEERLQCEANVELNIQQDLECVEFNKTAATCSCDFDGEQCNFYGLQRHMLEAALPLLPESITHLGATVSPANPYSLSNALACGFTIRARREMYGGFDRYLLAKEL